MTEDMKNFLETVSASRELTEKISTANKEELIAMAKELGIKLTDEDFVKSDVQAMSDDELDAIVGGGTCLCVMGGGGTSGENHKTCACVLGGGGESTSGKCRCCCVLQGTGDLGAENKSKPDQVEFW